MVRQAWDLDAIGRRYDEFRENFRGHRGDDALTAVVELVHAWRRFPWIDPLLPDELLPARWPGRPAAALFAQLHDRWAAAARAGWRTLNEAAA
jgi:phenylacetic acid degradation operon negative regulatory protein